MIYSNKLLLVLLFVLSSIWGFAQTFELHGRVSVHNSKYKTGTIEYLEEVKLLAPNSKEIKSDYKGRFQLNFEGLNKNDVVNVIAKKEGWVVANQADLDNVEIGVTPFLRVFLVKKEKLEQTQNELFAASQTAFLTLKDTFIFNLEVNKLDGQIAKEELGKRLGQEFTTIKEAKDFFQIITKDIEEILPIFAKELATVNLDFASDMYQTAYHHYLNGEIENAIVTIDEKKLDADFENIMLLINKANDEEKLKQVRKIRAIRLNQIKDSYALKSKCLQQVFRFKAANQVNRKLEQMNLALNGEKEIVVIEYEGQPTPIIKNADDEIMLGQALDSTKSIVPFDTMMVEKEILDSTQMAMLEAMQPKGNPKAITILEINDINQPPTADLKDVETALLVKVKSKITYTPEYEKEDSIALPIEEIITEDKIKDAAIEPVEKVTNSPSNSPTPIIYTAPKREIIEIDKDKKPTLGQFSITKKTSLRRGPSSKTKVLKRLNVGTKIVVLEKINRYWCRVLLNGKEGYVKALLLEKSN